jgi:hypothetical protein
VSFGKTYNKITKEVELNYKKKKNDQKQKNVLKLGFVSPKIWNDNDKKYCLASDKR